MTKNNTKRNNNRAKIIKSIVWKCYEDGLSLQDVINKLLPYLPAIKKHYCFVFDTKYFKDLGYNNTPRNLTKNSNETIHSEFCYISDRLMSPHRLKFLIAMLEKN